MKSGPKEKPPLERFWNNVTKTDGCWLWSDPAINRYGVLWLGKGKGQLSAHRFSYQLHHGEIPRGWVICHKCDVKNCVNPEHLYAGTHEDNTRDIVERGRFARSAGRVIKAKRVRHKQRALLPSERSQMIEEYKSGRFTQAELAKRYRMSQGAVSASIRGWPGRKEDGGKRRTGSYRRKLQPEAYDQIREKYATGQHTQTALAAEFGIDQTYVSAIIKRKTRRDLAEQQST